MFSRIRIHGRLTKNHEWFRFSRHIPPASKQFSKSDLYLMPVPSERENRQEPQNFHFFENFAFFWSLWTTSGATECFSFYDFLRIWLSDPENLGKSMDTFEPLFAAYNQQVAFYFPYGWSCVALPRALGLRLCEARPRLDKFFAVRLCEFPPPRPDRAVPKRTDTLVARPGVGC